MVIKAKDKDLYRNFLREAWRLLKWPIPIKKKLVTWPEILGFGARQFARCEGYVNGELSSRNKSYCLMEQEKPAFCIPFQAFDTIANFDP